MKEVAVKCRPATRDDIPEITRIITEGFLDYPLHIMLKPYLYQPDRYPQCVAAINRMLASSYQWVRHALVVEHEGRVVATEMCIRDRDSPGLVRKDEAGERLCASVTRSSHPVRGYARSAP